MENLKKLVNQIAYTPSQNISSLSPLQRSLIPFLSVASSLYKFALFVRRQLFHLGVVKRHRLPVPVISVGNLTWGGNGKTPMVEFIATWFDRAGISPLILTRGYAGGDEAKMLQRHLLGTSAKIGVGANRVVTAAYFLERYGCIDPRGNKCFKRIFLDKEMEVNPSTDRISAVILDDGMQHWRLKRDLEIVMVNGMMPWGNHQLLPLGPLREPLSALRKADVAVIHHADFLSIVEVGYIESTIRKVKETLPIFFTRLAPTHFFEIGKLNPKLSLNVVDNLVLLCVSAIGFAVAFVQVIEKIGALYVDRLDFSDHHLFKAKDIEIIRVRLRELQDEFGAKPIVVVTEKDYDRNPLILNELDPFKVLVLCSQLQIMPFAGRTEESFKNSLIKLLEMKFSEVVDWLYIAACLLCLSEVAKIK